MQTSKCKGRKTIQLGIFAVWASLVLAIPGANANSGNNGKNASHANHAHHADQGNGAQGDLVGSWLVWVVPKNCATGELIQAGAFEALFNFHADGTLDAWVQNRTINTTRSPSFGSWKPGRPSRYADHSFSARFIHLRYNPATGAFLGRQYAQSTIVVDRHGGEFTAEGRNTGFSPDNALEFEGCSVMTGARIEA